MVTVLYSISTMSGLAVVMVRSVGTVDTEPSQALWLGRSANTFAAGLDSLMKCANLDSTRSWRQVYLPSCNAVGQPHIIITRGEGGLRPPSPLVRVAGATLISSEEVVFSEFIQLLSEISI